eukprot:629041-Alexandrium_andersonii.AAC.1
MDIFWQLLGTCRLLHNQGAARATPRRGAEALTVRGREPRQDLLQPVQPACLAESLRPGALAAPAPRCLLAE